MNTRARVAAIAGGLGAAAAVAAALVFPVHHSAPVSTPTSGISAGAAGAAGNGSPVAQQASSGSTGTTGSAGTGSGSGGASGGSGSASGSGQGSGSGSGQGSGSGSGSGSGTSGGTTLPTPTGTIGNPNLPCLIGFTWRKAFPGDYVCVTPATYAATAADNAAAISRIQQGGGQYGPYTCLQGYVWRQVVPDDYTCVIPAVRAQAAYDNSQARNRVAALNVCVQPYFQGLFRYIGIDGDLFNFGPVELEVRHTGTGTLAWSGPVTATSIAGLPGGSFYYDTPVLMPSGPDYYIVALDVASGRFSNQFPVLIPCS